MICDVCREGLEGVWDPGQTKRVGMLQDFPEILRLRFRDVDDEGFDKVLSGLKLTEPERYVFGHHANYDSLLKSRRQGCVACNEIDDIEADSHDDANSRLAELGYYSVFCIGISEAEFDQPTMLVYLGEILEEIDHELVVHDKNDHISSIISSSTASRETWALVQSWLDKCLESHSPCSNQTLTGFSPTRLLELATTGSKKIFRLVQQGEFDTKEPYVTLSHCWGPGPASEKLQLIDSTMLKLRSGLPVKTLPKTFRHAFEIAERLGVRYIWIDRLCIIQESKDWEIESATMQTVYRNGFLNIAALGARSDADGCFFGRDPTLVGPTILNINSKQGLPSYYRFPQETQTWTWDFKSEPLIARGWVLQERMLAARNLYFGSRQVFWECSATNCCETMPTGPLLTYVSGNTARRQAISMKSERFAWKPLIEPTAPAVRQDHEPISNLLREWSTAVDAYCKSNLTYPKDKLVALSGLARDMGTKLRALNPEYDEYLYGIWKFTMPDSLLWKVKGPNNTRPLEYRAPSWSWASVDGPIDLPAGGGSSNYPLIQIIGVDALPRSKDAISQGSEDELSLRLKGPMCIAKGLWTAKRSNPLFNSRRIGSLHGLDTSQEIDACLAAPDIRFDALGDHYDEVFVMVFWTHPYYEMSEIVAGGLALVPVDESQTLYRRVGYAELNVDVNVDDHDLDYYNPVMNGCQVRAIDIV
ncbi:HET-domain-containing protein [Hypomontagnella monticulosa]|nr:HET-domain-containing protein [Hypomontagnella monticulosa]